MLTSSDFACEYCEPNYICLCLRHQYFEPWSRLINLLNTQLIEFARIEDNMDPDEWNEIVCYGTAKNKDRLRIVRELTVISATFTTQSVYLQTYE